MTVGETLTEARCRAGLSVDELSERTKIRQTVIRSIERDDYAACGGDLYVRGYVRAIAGAVGADAQQLIREYDLGRAIATGPAPAAGMADPDATELDLPRVPDGDAYPPLASPAGFADPAGPADPAETRFDLPPVPSADPAVTRFDLPPIGEDMMAAGYDLPPAGPGAVAAAPAGAGPVGATPADAVGPHLAQGPAGSWPAGSWPGGTGPAGSWPGGTGPIGTGPIGTGPAPRRRGGRRLLAGVAAVFLLAAGGVAIGLATSGSPGRNAAATSQAGATSPASPANSPAASPTAGAMPGKSAHPATSAKGGKTAKSGKHTATRHTTARKPVVTLPVTAAKAFGPAGLADGDNPQIASYAIARNAPQPWTSDWYTTARFGNLKQGTGLLLNLGHEVTITGVRITFTHYKGLNLQLKAGDGDAQGDFRTVAAASDTGGTVVLTLSHPARGSRLLLWFTLLPPDGQGTYQESVYHVQVKGRR